VSGKVIWAKVKKGVKAMNKALKEFLLTILTPG